MASAEQLPSVIAFFWFSPGSGDGWAMTNQNAHFRHFWPK